MTSSNTLLSLVHPRRRGITRFNTPIASILHPANTWHIKYLIKWIDQAQATYPASSLPYTSSTQVLDALVPLQQAAPNGLWSGARDHELENNRHAAIHLQDLFANLLHISRSLQYLHQQQALAVQYPLSLKEPLSQLRQTVAQLVQSSVPTITNFNTPCTR